MMGIVWLAITHGSSARSTGRKITKITASSTPMAPPKPSADRVPAVVYSVARTTLRSSVIAYLPKKGTTRSAIQCGKGTGCCGRAKKHSSTVVPQPGRA